MQSPNQRNVLTKKALLQKYLDMACHNLFCYSRNYAMTEPKDGYEAEWKQSGEEIQLLEGMIKDEFNQDLKNIDTKFIVEELSKREGVTKIIAEPGEKKEVVQEGPAIIFVVED